MGKSVNLRPKGRTISRPKLYLINSLLLLLPILYFGHGLILAALGGFLVVDEKPERSDAIVVLAGGDPGRALKAAELYRAGFAGVVVISSEPPPAIYERARRDGVELVTAADNYQRILKGYGVPSDKILRLAGFVSNTFEEVEHLRDFARGHGWSRLVVVTSNFHTRRTRMVCRYLLQPDIRVVVVASPYDSFNPDAWWMTQSETRTFAIELEKLLTYTLYIWPRSLWNSRESTKARSTSSVLPDLS